MTGRISDAAREHITQAWPAILAALAAGALVRDVLKAQSTTRTLIRGYLAVEPTARADWDDAREASADAFLDEAMEVARTPNTSQVGAADARTRIDTLKWAARIRNPRLYGDRAQLDVNVRTVDLTAIILAANARLAAAQVGRIIEHEVPRLSPFSDLI